MRRLLVFILAANSSFFACTKSEDVSSLSKELDGETNEAARLSEDLLAFDPAELDFGLTTARIGQVEAQATLRNAGARAAWISQFVATTEHFTVAAHDCPVAPVAFESSASCSLTLRFAPLSDGKLTAALNAVYATEENSEGTKTTTMALVGLGVGAPELPDPALTFSPDPLTFGKLVAGLGIAERSLVLTNVTDKNLRLGALQGIAAPFSLLSNDCPAGDLAPAASCTLAFAFQPETAGNFGVKLGIPHGLSGEDLDRTARVSLSGVGEDPTAVGNAALQLDPGTYSFGPVRANEAEAIRDVNVTNVSAYPVFIHSVAETSPHFDIASNGCLGDASELAPGKSCTIQVRFKPLVAGEVSTNVKLLYGLTQGASNFNTAVGLSGTGVATLAFGGLESVENVTTTKATLHWTHVNGATNYLVFHVAGDGSLTLLTSATPPTNTIHLTTLSPATNYTFRVRAIDGLGAVDGNTNDHSVTTQSLGTFQTLATLNVAEGDTVVSPALSCTDSYGSTSTFAVQTSTPQMTCQLLTSPARVSCAADYRSGHTAWSGSATVTCSMNDYTYSQVVDIDVSDTNRAPTLSTIPSETKSEGTSFTAIQTSTLANDADGDTLSYSCTYEGGGAAAGTSCASLPGVATFSSATGTLTWTPSYTVATGTDEVPFTVALTASDGTLNATRNVTLTVRGVAPTFTAIAGLSAAEGATAQSAALSCTDGSGVTPVFAIEDETDPDGTCSLTAAPVKLSCSPAKAGHSNWSDVVTVSCTLNDSTTIRAVTLSVTDTNYPPVLAAISDQTATEGVAITPVDAQDGSDDFDADGDALTYTCTFTGGNFTTATNCASLPGSASFSASAGTLTWTPGFDAAFGGASKVYAVKITAGDGRSPELTDTKTFNVTVADTPMSFTPLSTPVATTEGAAEQSAALSCDDTSGVVPNYSITAQSDAALNCALTSAPVKLACNPAYKTGHASWSGSVTVQCSLNGTLSSQVITFDVADTNRAPNLAAISGQTVGEGVAINAIDPGEAGADADVDGDAFFYTCTYAGGGAPAGTSCASLPGTVSFSDTTGQFNWTPGYTAVIGQPSATYSFEIVASDGQAAPLTSTRTFDIVVTDAPMTFTAISGVATVEGTPVQTAALSCSDGSGVAPTYQITNQTDTDGACSLTGAPVKVSCAPVKAGHSNWSSVVTVECELNGVTASRNFTLSVTDVNFPPVLTAIAGMTVTEGAAITPVDATDDGDDEDVDGDVLVYSCSYTGGGAGTPTACASLPGTAAFDSSTGQLTWTPSYSAAVGQNDTAYQITISASDGRSPALTDSETFVITVQNAPLVFTTLSSPLDAAEGANSQSAALACADGSGGTPTYSIEAQSDADANCTLTTAPIKVSCTPAYKTGHATWTSDVTLRCALGDGTTDQVLTVSVTDTNRAPSLGALNGQTVNAGEAITAVNPQDGTDDQDVDGDALTYTCTFSGGGHGAGTNCSSLPGSVTFDGATGVLAWTTTYGTAVSGMQTVYQITLTGSDGQSPALTDAKTFAVTVEPGTPPSLTITNPSPTGSTTFNLSWSGAGGASEYCILENDTDVGHCTFLPSPVPATFDVTAVDGSKVLSAWIKDASGATSGRGDSNAVIFDAGDPNWTSSPGHAAWATQNTTTPEVTYTADATDDGSGVDRYEYAVGTGTSGAAAHDVKDWTLAPASPFTEPVSGLADGATYYLNMRVVDVSGRTSAIRSSGGWTVDITAPNLTVSAPTEDEIVLYDDKEIEGTCETGRPISVVYGEFLTGPGTVTCANSTFSFLSSVSGDAGERQLTLTQTDLAGNSTQVVRKFQRAEPVGAKIFASRANSCIITTNKTGFCWGEAKQGQVGNGLSTIDQLAPVPLLGVGTEVETIAMGYYNSCLITTSGAAKCWGRGISGVNGDDTTGDRPAPVDVDGLSSGVTDLKVTTDYACAVVNGGAKCWGDGTYGRLGNGSTSKQLVPVDVTGLTSGIASVAVNIHSACALTTNGAVKCWGRNTEGQLGNNSTTDSSTPVDVSGLDSGVASIWANPGEDGRYFCAIMALDKSVRCWGYNNGRQVGDNTTTNAKTPVTVGTLTNVVQIAQSAHHACALTSDGAVTCWGTGSNGQLGDNTTTAKGPTSVVGLSSGVVRIAVNTGNSCAVLDTGDVKCWGKGLEGENGDTLLIDQKIPSTVLGVEGAVAIDAGQTHFCALTGDGTAFCWGTNEQGQLGNGTATNLVENLTAVPAHPSMTSQVTSFDGNTQHSCATIDDGTVKKILCWGTNANGRLGDGTTTTRYQPIEVSGITDGATDVKTADNFSCALVSGDVKCWGANTSGQLGDGTVTQRTTPVTVSGISGATNLQVAVTARRACAMVSDALYCWGEASGKELGDGGTTDQKSPVAIFESGVHDYSLGDSGGCAIVGANRTLKCWGENTTGEVGDGTGVDTASPVTTIAQDVAKVYMDGWGVNYFGCAIMTSGGVKCWGKNNVGQIGDGTTVSPRLSPVDVTNLSSGVVKLSLGLNHACALLDTGGVKCWGGNSYGQIGNNSTANATTPVSVSGLSSGVVDIVAGEYQTCAILTGGVPKCWGNNTRGQVGDTTKINRKVPVPLAYLTSNVKEIKLFADHTCALLSTGALRCWGTNASGQLGTDPIVRPPTAVVGFP